MTDAPPDAPSETETDEASAAEPVAVPPASVLPASPAPASAPPSASAPPKATGPAAPGVVARFGEYFTHARALAENARIGETARASIAGALGLAKQKAEAADALWSNGHAAEGLRLAVESLDEAMRAIPLDAAANPTPPAPISERVTEVEGEAHAVIGKVLAAHGVAARQRSAVEAAAIAIRTAELPRLDAGVAPAHQQLYAQSMEARTTIGRALGAVALTRRALLVRRATRIATVAVTFAFAIGIASVALKTPEGVFATASATWMDSPDYAPAKTIDGLRDTAWLLPDHSTGYLELAVTPARHVTRVRVLNSINAPWHDRATAAYRVEAYQGSTLATGVDGTFEYTETPDFVDVTIDAENVDRIRIVANGHHRLGAGIAEVEIQ